MTVRRLIVSADRDDERAAPVGGVHSQISLTDIPNANSLLPLYAVVQEQCDLGCWHNRYAVSLMPWGDR